MVAGFGFRAGAGVHSLCSAFQLARDGTPPITHLATLADKAEGLAELGWLLRLPIIAVTPEDLNDISTISSSSTVLAARGLGSVAEACALAALKRHTSCLLAPRSISQDRMATCAIAQGESL